MDDLKQYCTQQYMLKTMLKPVSNQNTMLACNTRLSCGQSSSPACTVFIRDVVSHQRQVQVQKVKFKVVFVLWVWSVNGLLTGQDQQRRFSKKAFSKLLCDGSKKSVNFGFPAIAVFCGKEKKLRVRIITQPQVALFFGKIWMC